MAHWLIHKAHTFPVSGAHTHGVRRSTSWVWVAVLLWCICSWSRSFEWLQLLATTVKWVVGSAIFASSSYTWIKPMGWSWTNVISEDCTYIETSCIIMIRLTNKQRKKYFRLTGGSKFQSKRISRIDPLTSIVTPGSCQCWKRVPAWSRSCMHTNREE